MRIIPKLLILFLFSTIIAHADAKQDALQKKFQTSLLALKDADDQAYQRLAQWCQANKLTKEATQVWQLLITKKKEQNATKPTLEGYQAIVNLCVRQNLKPEAEEAKRELLLFDYSLRKAKIAADDLKGLQTLAQWCQSNILIHEAIDTWKTIQILQPNNTQAQSQIDLLKSALWGKAPTGLLKNQKVPGYTQETAWYHLSVPKQSVPPKTGKDTGMPLIIFLHGGAHQAGTAENVVALAQVLPTFKNVMVLFPNHLNTWWSHPKEMIYLLDTIDQVQLLYHVDPKRIYLMGASMGGNGTWGFGSFCPELFAAIAPMSGFWEPFLEFPMKQLGSKPIYILHGTKDTTVPIVGARKAFAMMQAEKANVVMHEIDCAHQLPNDEIEKAAIWILQYTNTQTFEIKILKERISKLTVPNWLKQYPGN
jgi:pimeloyl-ACP methyl ester carboxylesterase